MEQNFKCNNNNSLLSKKSICNFRLDSHMSAEYQFYRKNDHCLFLWKVKKVQRLANFTTLITIVEIMKKYMPGSF